MLRPLLAQLCEALDVLDPKTMAPDTRKNHLDRAKQIELIKRSLDRAGMEMDEDPEVNLANGEAAFDHVYFCTHNDVVARAVAAAKKLLPNEVARYIVSAGEQREKLNKKRAKNLKP